MSDEDLIAKYGGGTTTTTSASTINSTNAVNVNVNNGDGGGGGGGRSGSGDSMPPSPRLSASVSVHNVSWRRHMFLQLKQRNALQRDAYQPIFQAYATLMSSNKDLEQKNRSLTQEVQLSGSGGGGGVDSATVQALEQKVSKLQEELASVYKEKSDYTQTILTLKEKAERDEEALVQKAEELAQKQMELDQMEDDGRGDKQRVVQLESTIKLLSDEVTSLKKAIAACEETIKTLTDDNKALVHRLLELKEHQASEMNEMNNAYDELIRKTQAKDREEKDASIDATMDYADSAAILDAVSWQSNFNVIIPGGVKRVATAHDGQVTSVQYNSAGSLLASGGTDGFVKIWDARTGQSRATLRGAKQSVMHVDFSYNDSMVLACGNDKCGHIWSMKTSRVLHTLTGHSNKIYACAFTMDGQKVVTGSHDRTLRVWNVSNGFSTTTIPCKSSVNFLAISPTNGNFLATAHLDCGIRFWSISTGELVHEIDKCHNQQATCVAFSNDGSQVVTNSRDNELHLIDSRTFDKIKTFSAVEGLSKKGVYKNAVNWNRVCWSPDNRYIVAGSSCGRLFVWDVNSGRLKDVLCPAHPDEMDDYTGVSSVAWNRNGQQLASCDGQGHVLFWEGDGDQYD